MGQGGGERKILDGGREVAAFIDVADQQIGDRPLTVGEFQLADLFHQVFLQRRLGDDRVEHVLPLLLVFGGFAERNVGGGEMIAPFLIELDQFLKFRLKIVDRFVALLLRCGVKSEIGRRLTGIKGIEGFLVCAGFLVFLAGFFDGDFFQDGILLEFLFHERLELKVRRL